MRAGAIGDRDLEHVLGKIDRYGRRIHDISSWLSRSRLSAAPGDDARELGGVHAISIYRFRRDIVM